MINLRDPYHSLDHFWMDIIIAVNKHIIIAIRMIECSISCCGNPSIFIDIYVNVWEFFRIPDRFLSNDPVIHRRSTQFLYLDSFELIKNLNRWLYIFQHYKRGLKY